MLERIRTGVRLRSISTTTEAPAAAKRDPKKVQVKRLGQAVKSGGGSGSDFEESPVDLAEIGRAYYTDSYIRRAVDKHSTLMFKNGWELAGKDDGAVEYVWTRLKLMAESTNQSVESFLQEIGDSLVLYSNSYLVKARAKTGGMPAGVTAVGYTGKQPIAGYFVLPSQFVTIQRDEAGKVLAYQQSTGSGGEGVEFKATEIVHFPYKRPSGRAYGVPFIFNALDDVKLLRQIEENVARLIYRNLFPLYLYKVGIDKPGFEATDEEIEALRDEIRNIPVDGALVVPERHSIEVVGSQGQAIDANGYLKYFRERVFSGLGVSDTVMGIAGTANKSTSDNMSADLIDSVKDFQKTFADIFNFYIINELLFEGGYDPILNPDHEVLFQFNEVEFDAKIKRENHIVQLFMQNSITFEEMRQMMGQETVVDESRLMFNMITGALAQQSTDAQMAIAAQKATTGAANQGNNKNQPANQHGKQTSPGKPKREFVENLQSQSPSLQETLQIESFTQKIEKYWDDTLEDIQGRIARSEDMDVIVNFTTGLSGQVIKEKIHPFVEKAFLVGYQDGLKQAGNQFAKLKPTDIKLAVKPHIRSFERLMADTTKSVSSSYEKESPIGHVKHAFNASRYRIRFISKRISYEAYNYGVALAAEKSHIKEVSVRHKENCCQKCLTSPESIPLKDGWRQSIPPHHTNCECLVVITKKEVI